jgi:thiamine-monophosphate kinase
MIIHGPCQKVLAVRWERHSPSIGEANISRVIIPNMNVSQIGEFGLIHELAEKIQGSRNTRFPAWQNLVLGIGDDTAAWHNEPGLTLATTDCLVEGVHFTRATTSWRDLGWKALAVNLSDIAAMGGSPRYALVTLAMPADTNKETAEELYAGMLELANGKGVAIAGGDTSASPLVFINVALTGVSGKHLLTRSAARPGDVVAVTGYLGVAAAGWRFLKSGQEIPSEAAPLLAAFQRPIPHLAEGSLLVEAGVKAAIDVSDGLVADLGHICEQSKVGARIEIPRLPLHPAVKTLFPAEAIQMALGGGEDYKLLFTAPAEIITRVSLKSTCEITVIGEVTDKHPGQVELFDESGKPFKTPDEGWQHFAPH